MIRTKKEWFITIKTGDEKSSEELAEYLYRKDIVGHHIRIVDENIKIFRIHDDIDTIVKLLIYIQESDETQYVIDSIKCSEFETE